MSDTAASTEDREVNAYAFGYNDARESRAFTPPPNVPPSVEAAYTEGYGTAMCEIEDAMRNELVKFYGEDAVDFLLANHDAHFLSELLTRVQRADRVAFNATPNDQ